MQDVTAIDDETIEHRLGLPDQFVIPSPGIDERGYSGWRLVNFLPSRAFVVSLPGYIDRFEASGAMTKESGAAEAASTKIMNHGEPIVICRIAVRNSLNGLRVR